MTTTCEDFPCCGHQFGECADRPEFTGAYWAKDPHLLCDHENGVCDMDRDMDDDEDDTCGCGEEGCGSC